jgi:hypothetical protein
MTSIVDSTFSSPSRPETIRRGTNADNTYARTVGTELSTSDHTSHTIHPSSAGASQADTGGGDRFVSSSRPASPEQSETSPSTAQSKDTIPQNTLRCGLEIDYPASEIREFWIHGRRFVVHDESDKSPSPHTAMTATTPTASRPATAVNQASMLSRTINTLAPIAGRIIVTKLGNMALSTIAGQAGPLLTAASSAVPSMSEAANLGGQVLSTVTKRGAGALSSAWSTAQSLQPFT